MDNQEVPIIFLFGLSEPRKFLYQDLMSGEILTEKDVLKDSQCINEHMIDTYIEGLRETMSHHAEMIMNPVGRKVFFKEWHNYLLPEIRDWPLWPSYFKFSRENKKNRLEKIYEQVNVVKFSPILYKFYKNGERIEPCEHTKRGCKIGIDIVKARPNTTIYFVLDALDKREVIDRRYGKQAHYSSLTASELRYIYRNWEGLEDKVIFFEDRKRTGAPWTEWFYKDKWKNYAAGGFRKLRKSSDMKEADPISTKKISVYISKDDAPRLQSLNSLKTKAYEKKIARQEIYRKNHSLTLSSKNTELII